MANELDADWHLKEWMQHFGKRQAALTNELGWAKHKANKIWHGRQPYRREEVNQVAAWLGVRPYELLMLPEEALALRRLRETAVFIAAESTRAPERPPKASNYGVPPSAQRTGTTG